MLTFLLLLVAAPSAAVEAPPAPAAKAKDAPDKIRCRLIQEVHSRVPSRICRTNKEWDLIAKEAEDSMHTSRNKSFDTNPMSSGN